jgi:hypothetical protein
MNSPSAPRLRSVVLDCPDPPALATFYARLLDGRADTSDPHWCVVYLTEPALKLAFQLAGPVPEDGGAFIVHADPAGHPFCLFEERPVP